MKPRERSNSDIANIRINRINRVSTLKTRMILPRSRDVVFPYFADAGNLEKITPPWLCFQILTPRPIEMRAGTLIEYQLRLHGIPVSWLTEITLWNPPFRFVDEQKRGPYRKWIHEHTFVECGDNCEMRDVVQYDPPGGALADSLFVRRNVRRIFAYRAQKLSTLFAP